MSNDVLIERLGSASEVEAEQIGTLLQALSARHDGQPVPIERLKAIVDNPDRDQFVARLHGRIVGCATLNLIVGTMGEKAWLEDFVVSDDETVRGRGIGYALWRELIDWCGERQVPLQFSSHPDRADAHAFYARQGAIATSSTLFRVEPPS